MVMKKTDPLLTQLGIECGKLLRTGRGALFDGNGSTGSMDWIELSKRMIGPLGERSLPQKLFELGTVVLLQAGRG